MKPKTLLHYLIAALIICCAGILLGGPSPTTANSADSIEAPQASDMEQGQEPVETHIITVKDGDIDIDTEETLEKAHKELQRALEKIKLHHLKEIPEGLQTLKWISKGDRPQMGILFDPTNEKASKSGLEVLGVTPGSPAEEAGIKAGDIITKIDELQLEGDSTTAISKVLEHLGNLEAGDTVHLVALREGNTRESDLKLRKSSGEKKYKILMRGDEDFDFEIPDIEKSFSFLSRNDLDLELAALNDGLAEYFGTHDGVLVLEIPDKNSLGLRAGDVIQLIGGREAQSPEHAFRIFRSYDADEEMILHIIRHGKGMDLKGVKK